MSLFDSASLVITPNGQKAGKLYSIKPSDGSGDLVVTRATTATRVNSAGLVEVVPVNLLQYSEQFDNAAWVKAGVNITPNTTIAPNGTLTADTLNASIELYQTIPAITNTTYTISLWVKLLTATNLCLVVNNAAAWNTIGGESFDATDGLNTSTWTRISYTFTTPSTLPVGVVNFHIGANSETGLTQSAGNVYIWGAQVVEGSTAKSYYPTTTRLNIPRLDYTNGSCPSILVEPQRTNLALRSEEFNNAYWTTLDATVTANNTNSPSGNSTADQLAGNGNGTLVRLSSSIIAGTLNATYTASCFFKKGTNNFVLFQAAVLGATGVTFAYVDLVNGTSPQSGVTIKNYGNDWYRVSFTFTLGAIFANIDLRIFPTPSTTTTTFPTNADALNKSVYIYGAQLEAGSYATSYIPTTSASVTRNADVISKTGISSLIGQTEGVLLFDFKYTQLDSNGLIPITIGQNSSNHAYFYIDGNESISFDFIYSGSDVVNISTASGFAVKGQRYKIAFAYKQNDFVLYINGVQIGTDNSGLIPSFSELNFGYPYAIGYSYPNSINLTALWKTRLTNAELAQLTTI
jgi:hypothetical protein